MNTKKLILVDVNETKNLVAKLNFTITSVDLVQWKKREFTKKELEGKSPYQFTRSIWTPENNGALIGKGAAIQYTFTKADQDKYIKFYAYINEYNSVEQSEVFYLESKCTTSVRIRDVGRMLSFTDLFAGESITLKILKYNVDAKKVASSVKEKIKWMVRIEGKDERLIIDGRLLLGEEIEFTIPVEWGGKSVMFMPYLNIPTPKVSYECQILNEKDWKITGPATVSANSEVEYMVKTDGNIPECSIKWVVEIDGMQHPLGNGSKVGMKMKSEWHGKDIFIMPYLKTSTPTKKKSLKVHVKRKNIVFFVGGAGDKKSFTGIDRKTNNIRGVKILFENRVSKYLNIEYHTVYLGYYELYPERDIEEYVIKEIEDKSIPIYVVGHSLGGWNGAFLAYTLSRKGYQVKMLITLDPVLGNYPIIETYHSSNLHKLRVRQPYFWINIITNPPENDNSDRVAALGQQWIEKKGPNIYYETEYSHRFSQSIFTEIIKDGKSALDFLEESTLK
ncbi:lipase family protein [Bacteroides sp. 224]|uniref:lipase family protein n=1 Tax=Bacteroides sp. 224 TaxID=2302936 RepID=UPI0013D199D9|nr:lipase family protein [Bacteroides sp. 224]NDV65075.1 hypothetical protein [Bacteroides sp. 224]